VSGRVALCLPSPEGVATYFVTGLGVISPIYTPGPRQCDLDRLGAGHPTEIAKLMPKRHQDRCPTPLATIAVINPPD
jgi:hypothetical protein